jgi:hypothetical protein
MLEKKGLEKEVEFFFAPRGVLYYIKNRRRIEKKEDYLVDV